MSDRFPRLFSPFAIGDVSFKNRIFSTGHDTSLTHGIPNDALTAYHRARAKGGAALIVVEVAGVHKSALYHSTTIRADTDDCIPGYRDIAKACHAYDCRVFGQLFHAGREVMEMADGTVPAAYSASDTPNERFHLVPRPMSRAVIRDMIGCYAAAGARMAEAGLDGIEIVASHGYLPAQFLNPRVNRRTDEYGGGAENRARFLVEIAQAVRARVGGRLVGFRISGSEPDSADGLDARETLEICDALAPHFDYFNVTVGSSASLGGSLHIVPTMGFEQGYTAPYGAMVRARVKKPVFIAGRINRPDVAERILEAGQADMCAMTRGMVCDPEIANKSREGRVDEIRTCIACNQACIGHIHKSTSISCIQYPESGRELEFGSVKPPARKKKVMVVGGGPAGLKAAAVAAARGHDVTLYEREARLGGQVVLAEKLPGRMEFGGLTDNLQREAERAGVRVARGHAVTAGFVRSEKPDAVVLATGARPRAIELAGGTEGAHVVDSWQVLKGQANLGGSVVIADWRCDWVGLGLAEMAARDGRRVRLCVNGYMPGQVIQQYVRDQWLGTLHKLGVEIIPMVRAVGADADTGYFEHTTSGQPVLCEGMETMIANLARESDSDLETALENYDGEIVAIGDCVAPRTAEEAVLEGLRAAVKL
jgi:2,4-dienoyl-CoA reductase-like NADH-dependent reductase (Old Yellow Enzyme family)